jgi:hypothetical protein
MAERRKLTPKRLDEWSVPFLAALRNSANVRAACQAAQVSRQSAYVARDRHATFRRAWDDALADAVDTLEAAAWQRARSISDTLLIFLLKAHRRDLYGDRVTLDVEGLVARYAEEHGVELTDADRARAVAESTRMLKELSRAGGR